MKKNDRCSNRKEKTQLGCRSVKDIQTVQPFPTSGLLAENLGLPLPVLKSQIGNAKDRVYSYVLSTVRIDPETTTFEQHGSAPNFQGDVTSIKA